MTAGGPGRDERAVSPVIGVILMVAITVVLAGVIGTFIFEFGDTLESDVQAGANIDYDANRDEISVTFTSGNSEDTYLKVRFECVGGSCSGTNETETLSDIGDDYRSTGWSDGDRVKVIVTAHEHDRKTVVQSKTQSL